MTKTNKNKITQYTIFVLILVILIVGSFFVVMQTGITGTSLLSLQKTDLQSSFEYLDGEVWVYSFRMGGLGQKLVGLVEAEDVSVDGKQPEYDFEFSAEMIKQECIYDIAPTSDTKIYSIEKITGAGDAINFLGQCIPGEWEKVCTDNSKEALFAYKQILLKCEIICGTPLTSVVGHLDTQADLNSQIELTATSRGITNTLSFNTLTDESRGKIGDNTYAIWQGDLSSGVSCPDSSQYKPIYRDNKWVLVDNQKYDDYRDVLNDVEMISDKGEYDDWKERYDRAKAQALYTKSFGDIQNPSEMFNSQIKSEVIGRPITYPTITAYIKADWLGVYTPVGEPKILSSVSECFMPSASGIIVVDIKNVGDELGSFVVTAECESELFNLRHSVPATIKAGDTQKVYLPISGGDTDKKINSRCNVIVSGIALSDNMYTDVCINPVQTCKIGELQCVEDNIRQCNEHGTGWNLFKDCDYICSYDKNYKPYCEDREPEPSCGDGVCTGLENRYICPEDCAPELIPEWMKQVGFGLLALLAGLLVFLTGRALMVKFGGAKEDKLTLIILGVIGLLIAGLTYIVMVQYWLHILIIVGILLLVMFVVKVVVR